MVGDVYTQPRYGGSEHLLVICAASAEAAIASALAAGALSLDAGEWLTLGAPPALASPGPPRGCEETWERPGVSS